MNHKAYGYDYQKDHTHIVNKEEAEKIRKLFVGYLSGLSVKGAMEAAGIDRSIKSGTYFLTNRKYVSEEEGFPAIIYRDIFERVQSARMKRFKSHELVMPKVFIIEKPQAYHGDPFEQAEYMYSLIKGHY